MSWIQKLNPINWLKSALISDYVGGLIRHGLTFIAGALVVSGLASQEAADQAAQALINLLTDEQFMSGLIALVSGLAASAANKKSE